MAIVKIRICVFVGSERKRRISRAASDGDALPEAPLRSAYLLPEDVQLRCSIGKILPMHDDGMFVFGINIDASFDIFFHIFKRTFDMALSEGACGSVADERRGGFVHADVEDRSKAIIEPYAQYDQKNNADREIDFNDVGAHKERRGDVMSRW